MMKPSSKYKEIMQSTGFIPDSAQLASIDLLDDLYDQIIRRKSIPKKTSWLSVFKSKIDDQTVKGLYFWGGVGRGKTFLMDYFISVCRSQERNAAIFTAS